MHEDDVLPHKQEPGGSTFAGELGGALGGFLPIAALFALVGAALYFLVHWAG